MKALLIGFALVMVVLLGLLGALVVGVVGGGAPSTIAADDIPAAYLSLYRSGADTCPGLPWSVLAAIGKVETNHGRLQAPGVSAGANFAGAAGPMQIGMAARRATPSAPTPSTATVTGSATSTTRPTRSSPPPTTCAATAAARAATWRRRCSPTTMPTGM
jgi:hypothetical protein